ncbi:MAG: HEAT repeat domain-containing protein [Gemmatimonadota bacterium]|nr:HEAT repeat domain-containing protein [Gemmatimonadota bacterium]
MSHRVRQRIVLVLLAAVFAIGLTFATVELPYLVDDVLQTSVTTPGLDSHADEISRLKTELFISHFHLRAIGYVCFALLVLAIVVGFATRRTELAAVGALGFMLPVFAQFAGVMFFLAGLGMLNLLWLPVLDVSFELSRLGLVVRAPYDLLMWLFRQVGIDGYWPTVYLFLGSGLLLFFLGTFAWLSARAREQDVADFWVYRISRHPQYLGWILWSYGVYLLLLRNLYPKRSWGIDASLPWLVSTLIIIGVAMMEELHMRQKFGAAYEAYRRRAPFLLPVPKFVATLFTLPSRLLFRKNTPERKREVAVVMSLYAVVLIAISALAYGGGWTRTISILSPSGRDTKMERLATQLVEEPNRRSKYFIALRLAAFGDPAVDHLAPLLRHEDAEVRRNAADMLGRIPSARAVPALVSALNDSLSDVRGRAASALGVIGSAEAVEPLLDMTGDSEAWVRSAVMRSLARLGATDLLPSAAQAVNSPDMWFRASAVESVGILGSERGLPLVLGALRDEEPHVRRSAVVAALLIGSPLACDALAEASSDDDWEVRIYAAETRRRLDCPR